MSAANAFQWREFVQPVEAKKAGPVRGYERPGFVEPRKIIQSDAAETRLALNASGKFVRVCMGTHKPGLNITTQADCKVIRKREAAI